MVAGWIIGRITGLIYISDQDTDKAAAHIFDDTPGGVNLVVDKMSVPYLTGAKIDFADTIESQGFTIDNPNAGGSCACGDSFN